MGKGTYNVLCNGEVAGVEEHRGCSGEGAIQEGIHAQGARVVQWLMHLEGSNHLPRNQWQQQPAIQE